jgi:Uri superfamily endonuclease
VATEPLTATTYQLFIEVSVPVRVSVGRLGCFDFPAGEYVYTGSARSNFAARVNRHLSPSKKMHWHIDYLLATAGVSVREVLCYADPECAVNQQTVGDVVVSGFGSSDCRAGCGSHLKRLG